MSCSCAIGIDLTGLFLETLRNFFSIKQFLANTGSFSAGGGEFLVRLSSRLANSLPPLLSLFSPFFDANGSILCLKS